MKALQKRSTFGLLLILLILFTTAGGFAASIINDSVHIGGTLTADVFDVPDGSIVNADVSSSAAIARSKLALDELKTLEIPHSAWKIWDSLQQLPSTSSADDLGLYAGTFGTNAALIRTADLKAAGATTVRARAQITLPPEYESAQDVQIRAFTGMVTTVADTSCTIDFEAYEITGAGVSADLVTTAATTMNSTTFANKDFAVTASSLVAGDTLDIRVTIVCTDGATATAVIAAIAKTQLLLDRRG